jgi:glycosyltransferase A (GT-A) superfamily protein (DUF2064 family)
VSVAAIVILAKYPVPGRTKTRLGPRLSPDGCAAVQAAFVKHVVRRLKGVGVPVHVMVDPPDHVDEMALLLDLADVKLSPQPAGDLGVRIAAARSAHAGPVLILGTDSPDAPLDAVQRLATEHTSSDPILGPTDDGGFWCIRIDAADCATYLTNIEWSSGREREQVFAAARAAGLRPAKADAWDDVDHPPDLDRLIDRLRGSTDPLDRDLLAELAAIPGAVLDAANETAPASPDAPNASTQRVLT